MNDVVRLWHVRGFVVLVMRKIDLRPRHDRDESNADYDCCTDPISHKIGCQDSTECDSYPHL